MMKKGAMELEYIAKVIIIMVVISVMLSIMLMLYNKVKYHDFFDESEDKKSKFIELNGLDDETFKDYIRSCYYKFNSAREDVLCYTISLQSPYTPPSDYSDLNNEGIEVKNEVGGSTKNIVVLYEFFSGKIVIKGG